MTISIADYKNRKKEEKARELAALKAEAERNIQETQEKAEAILARAEFIRKNRTGAAPETADDIFALLAEVNEKSEDLARRRSQIDRK